MKSLACGFLVLFLLGCATLQKQPTADLKLRWNQCAEFLTGEKKAFDLKFGPLLWMAMQGDDRKDRIEEKERIERELFRRWKAGDKEAFLPIFGN
jgi:hypothetical protein